MTALPVQPIAQALTEALAAGLSRLEAQILLLHTLGRPRHDRAWLLAHDRDAMDAEALAAFQSAWRRRLDGEPVAYITGQREFHGLELAVDARVLDPRPDTETLVDWALERLQTQAAPCVLDLGTGSGAVALALASSCPQAQVSAVDLSPQALAVAQANAEHLGLQLRWHLGNWFDTEPALMATYDMIVSNPPYIAAADPHLAALTHEPLLALVSGEDGLDAIRHIVAQAPAYLSPGGWLLLEHGYDQAEAVQALLRGPVWVEVQSRMDLAGRSRCTGARLA